MTPQGERPLGSMQLMVAKTMPEEYSSMTYETETEGTSRSSSILSLHLHFRVTVREKEKAPGKSHL